jgi:hypothetical protein
VEVVLQPQNPKLEIAIEITSSPANGFYLPDSDALETYPKWLRQYRLSSST